MYPKPQEIFKALQLCPFKETKVVIVSQDPYPFGQAHGLAFSTMDTEAPYSLRMIFRELDRNIFKTKDYKEFKTALPNNNLTPWTKQGVLLLNRVLTVRAGAPGSHNDLGWQEFTGKVLELLYNDPTPKVFVCWGAEAKKAIEPLINPESVHLILEAGHPASGSHGKDKFSGNSHFSKINNWLNKRGIIPINWKL